MLRKLAPWLAMLVVLCFAATAAHDTTRQALADPVAGAGGACGGGNQQNWGNAPNCSFTSQPTVNPSTPTHIKTAAYVGRITNSGSGMATYDATTMVTQTQIHNFLSFAINGQVGFGPGRCVNVSDAGANTFCVAYIDVYRPNNGSPGAFGGAFLTDSLYSPGCGLGGVAGLTHSVGCTVDDSTTRMRPVPPNVYALNFNNPQTSSFAQLYMRGTISGTNPCCTGGNTGPDAPSGTPAPGSGDSGSGLTSNSVDGWFSDTSSTDVATWNKTTNCTQEICGNTAFVNALTTWWAAAPIHSDGVTPFQVWMNGASTGQNNSPTAGKGSCAGTAVASDCGVLAQLPNVTGLVLEFICQAQPTGPGQVQATGSACPYFVNSKTNILALGKATMDLSEYENATYGTACAGGSACLIGTSANTLMMYYTVTLLTYNPANLNQVSFLDLQHHTDADAPNRLSVWRVQQFVPSGASQIAIPCCLAYSDNGGAAIGSCTKNCHGIDGCYLGGPGNENDAGGILPYLVAGSCGKADNGTTDIGVYANAALPCAVNGLGINAGSGGACAWFANLTGSAYTVPCAAILTLGTDLGVTWHAAGIGTDTFQHQVDIGQFASGTHGCGATTDCVFGDILPSDGTGGGGTMGVYNGVNQGAPFTCGTTQIPADSGMIITR